nr:unnamed protein product [Digitaria exilis]
MGAANPPRGRTGRCADRPRVASPSSPADFVPQEVASLFHTIPTGTSWDGSREPATGTDGTVRRSPPRRVPVVPGGFRRLATHTVAIGEVTDSLVREGAGPISEEEWAPTRGAAGPWRIIHGRIGPRGALRTRLLPQAPQTTLAKLADFASVRHTADATHVIDLAATGTRSSAKRKQWSRAKASLNATELAHHRR